MYCLLVNLLRTKHTLGISNQDCFPAVIADAEFANLLLKPTSLVAFRTIKNIEFNNSLIVTPLLQCIALSALAATCDILVVPKESYKLQYPNTCLIYIIDALRFQVRLNILLTIMMFLSPLFSFFGLEKVVKPRRGGNWVHKLFSREAYWILHLNTRFP